MPSLIPLSSYLILTVVILRIFHHDPSPLPRVLRYATFHIIARLVLFSFDENNKDVDSKKCVEKVNTESVLKFKHMDQDEKERHIKEWQAVAKILDKLLLFINLFFMIIAFGYCYTVLYTN